MQAYRSFICKHIDSLYASLSKVYKEFERQLLLKGIGLSADKVLDIAKTVSTVTIDVGSNRTMSKTLLLTDEQRLLAPLLHLT